jgi:hypothetical protein
MTRSMMSTRSTSTQPQRPPTQRRSKSANTDEASTSPARSCEGDIGPDVHRRGRHRRILPARQVLGIVVRHMAVRRVTIRFLDVRHEGTVSLLRQRPHQGKHVVGSRDRRPQRLTLTGPEHCCVANWAHRRDRKSYGVVESQCCDGSVALLDCVRVRARVLLRPGQTVVRRSSNAAASWPWGVVSPPRS